MWCKLSVVLLLLFEVFVYCGKNEMQARPCCDSISMPPTILFSIYMGKIKYNYFALTVESMRLNPEVNFVIINVVEDGKDQSGFAEHVLRSISASNIVLKVLTIDEWRYRVNERLGIDIPFTSKWYYKLCDYKPALAYLFPELIYPPTSEHSQYSFWGYADIDLIWGNFTRFAHLFQGKYYFVKPHWFDVVGMAQFFKLDDFSVHLFKSDPFYIQLLANRTYHNLDETGRYTPPDQVRYKSFSINDMVHRIAKESQRDPLQPTRIFNQGDHANDNLHIEMKIIYHNQDIPVVSWVRGDLRVVHRRLGFPAGRELLFTHRMLNIPFPQLPPNKRREMIEDMITYGYLLPNWIPLLTRHMCRQHYTPNNGPHHQFYEYFPYNISCFGD